MSKEIDLVKVTTLPCPVCKKESEMFLEKERFERWQGGELIQNVFPDLSANQRELLITGTHSKCWDALFGKENFYDDVVPVGKSIIQSIFDAGETCDKCEQKYEKVEDIKQVGDIFVHKVCPRRNNPTQRRQIDLDCSFCKEQMNNNNNFFPPHDPSPGCESGKREHCTCDTCF